MWSFTDNKIHRLENVKDRALRDDLAQTFCLFLSQRRFREVMWHEKFTQLITSKYLARMNREHRPICFGYF